MTLHPDRYSTTGVSLRKRGVVIHTNEGADGSGPSLDRYMASPGDRPLSDGRKYGSGYHARASGVGWLPYIGPEAGPFAAPPCNKTWWHIVIPGWSRQTRAEWLDDTSRAFIRSVARFVVYAWEADEKSWPLEVVDEFGLQQGRGGYTAHNWVSRAWHQSDHTDPGPNFPWDLLQEDIAALTAPPPPAPIIDPKEDEMLTRYRWRQAGTVNEFLIPEGLHLTPQLAARYGDLELITEDHQQMRDSLLFRNGLSLDDLVPG